ncbi:ADP-heptosyltransferase [Endomicrobiia bacterium]|nr:ADP-heptosyltransferase [Endomicrobiia bacterium]GHT65439.1 ADP-heptosyltransferase [Endomicrobiia bacterium]GHT74811.1 ADP-heptosyltransferase [Endomicrobiia bacterium]
MDKIILFHMNQLGDLLFSLPVLKAAKQELTSQIYSVIKPGLAPLLIFSGLVDGVVPKDKNSISIIRKGNFSKAVLFSESPSSLISAFLSGIKERIGFDTASLSFLLTKKAQRTGVPSLFNNRSLGLAAGLQTIQHDYTDILNIPKENLNNVQKWFEYNHCDVSNTIAISVGASNKRQDKCLEESKWIEVVNILSCEGFSCVLSGAKWEREILNKIARKCRTTPKLFIAENSILDSAAFLKKCSLFVGIDSGAMHLAAAVGTKCIGVFGYTDSMQIGPMPLEKHVIIKKGNISQIMPEDIVAKVMCKLT